MGGLRAKDATGRVLPASMTLNGNQLTWQIDDRNAVYPLTIDPQVVSASAATATFPGGGANDQFGYSVALSSDGTLALISAGSNSTGALYAGAAYLFSKPSGGWSGTNPVSSATATFTGGAADDLFGSSVALSSDGTLVIVGANQNGTVGSIPVQHICSRNHREAGAGQPRHPLQLQPSPVALQIINSVTPWPSLLMGPWHS